MTPVSTVSTVSRVCRESVEGVEPGLNIFWHGPLCLSGVLSVFFRGELRVGAVRWCWVRVTRAAGARYAGWGRPATRA